MRKERKKGEKKEKKKEEKKGEAMLGFCIKIIPNKYGFVKS